MTLFSHQFSGRKKNPFVGCWLFVCLLFDGWWSNRKEKKMTDQPKLFFAMLNGLLRKLYGDEESRSSITVEFLLGQVFKDTDATAEQVGALFTLCERIISRAALELWDLSTFEE